MYISLLLVVNSILYVISATSIALDRPELKGVLTWSAILNLLLGILPATRYIAEAFLGTGLPDYGEGAILMIFAPIFLIGLFCVPSALLIKSHPKAAGIYGMIVGLLAVIVGAMTALMCWSFLHY